MKCHLISAALAFGAAALLGLAGGGARADGPLASLPQGLPAGAPTPAAVAAPDASAPATPPAAAPGAPAAVPAPPPAACCPSVPCEEPCFKKVCVPSTDVRKVDKRCYGEVCEDFCVPKCSLTGGLMHLHGHKHDDCGACPAECAAPCASCEHHVRERKYLVVRIKKEEEVINKCHVEYQPEEPKCKHSLFGHKKACDEGACLPPVECAGAVPPAKMPLEGEKIGPPKEKEKEKK